MNYGKVVVLTFAEKQELSDEFAKLQREESEAPGTYPMLTSLIYDILNNGTPTDLSSDESWEALL